ncbi:Clan CA, family C19, ubiquitin hydrolase-like cysteine peptidase [Tritrichomonas foetus]|uniref:ubiquitinyl hydrolase 1 n=1 Tax=Tritrichomonas foetus TaxID=1144522 RepID=A0A1J4K692_9EUKA|nr:Clan CA, family C19, ubiquitin hydrolase-like cysteine peptidase [Tritrichomonas foetus]|eukprot:OHT06400.1 Clan CA, family C19, ubiquitin hydrolase-like cysteine peptidase [Tritrichomonas foetus]
MRRSTSSTREGRRPIHFIVSSRNCVPIRYFGADWVNTIMKQNIVKQPLGGLSNLGNSCFMNCVLQCLAYAPGLAFFAEHIPNIIYEKNLGKPCFLHHFGEMCKALRMLPCVTPYVFYNNIEAINPGMKSGFQQDAHEFLFSLLNKFDTECAKAFGRAHGSYDTPIYALFGGKLSETRTCQRCGNENVSDYRFLDITITIESNSIESCLEQFFKSEKLDSTYKCENCKKAGTCTHNIIFQETPQILIITMMRFTANGSKIELPVDFGFEIDLSSFTAKNVYPYFELFAVINHDGHELSHGHFSTFIRCENGNWYSINDSKVIKVPSKSVLMSRPYVLFYKRKPVRMMKPIYVHFGLNEDSDSEFTE